VSVGRPVTFVVPSPLRSLAGGRGRVEVRVAQARPGVPPTPAGPLPTVGDAFEALRRSHPGLYDRMVDEAGRLRPHVNVFVGPDDIRWMGGFEAPVGPGEELVVLPSVSGG